jgi:hypothetical protein
MEIVFRHPRLRSEIWENSNGAIISDHMIGCSDDFFPIENDFFKESAIDTLQKWLRSSGFVRDASILKEFQLTTNMIMEAVEYTHKVLDNIDEKLISSESVRLVELVELANFSAIVGNLFRGGIVRASNGIFEANDPHIYPDLLGPTNIEIKVALENNSPKGHLIKPGPHITIRYVLGSPSGYKRGKENRGNVAWIWEVRVGNLREEHFNFSNTSGDSGKTAVVNASGLRSLDVIYCDFNRIPLSKKGKLYKNMKKLFEVDE